MAGIGRAFQECLSLGLHFGQKFTDHLGPERVGSIQRFCQRRFGVGLRLVEAGEDPERRIAVVAVVLRCNSSTAMYGA